MRDPKVIHPEGFDCAAAWKGCDQAVKDMGGLNNEDGETNWGAAFAADPGCVGCPVCHASYANWGNIIECLDCQFQFPNDWWPQYSYGVQAAWRVAEGGEMSGGMRRKCEASPFYKYGFENPPERGDRLYEIANRLPWKEIMAGVEFKYQSRMVEMAFCRRCGNEKQGRAARSTQLCEDCEATTRCEHIKNDGGYMGADQVCAAGIRIGDLAGEEPGWGNRQPCHYIEGGCPVKCIKFKPIGIEKVRANNAEMEAAMGRFMLTGPLIQKVKTEHKGENWSGVEECPACKGKLHMSHAKCNGHVHGQCETEDCLSWME